MRSHRLSEFAELWEVGIERVVEGRYSIVGFGRWRGRPVVLKVAKPDGDETDSGTIAAAFHGKGMVRRRRSA